MRLPPLAFALGFAGLLPQLAAVLVLATGTQSLRLEALILGYAYAALILSFLGGIWWGVAARVPAAPSWLWIAAVLPSLLALASALPWMAFASPGFSLGVVGAGLIATLAVDRRLAQAGLVPGDWMRLRVPLSLGLGVLTLAAAALA